MQRLWLGGALAVLLVACDETTPFSLEAPQLVVQIAAPELIEVPPGASLRLTIRVTRADGTPATQYELLPITSCECALLEPLTLTGTEHVILKKSAMGYGTTFAVRGKVPDSSYSSMSEPHWLVALPEPATKIEPLVPSASLAVGERRPFVAVATANRHPVGPPNAYALSNALASVDDAGVVTALAAGETVLTISNGTVSTDVALTIEASARIGLPPEGVQVLGLPFSGNNQTNVGQSSSMLDHTLVVDSRGYPHALVTAANRAAVMSWSGTGFGLELLPDAYTPLTSAWLAIDERDQLYVLSVGSTGAFVFDKPAPAPPSAWRRRALSQRVAGLDRAGADFTRYTNAVERLTLSPRPGGGLELVYGFRIGPVSYAYPCGALFRFARVTDDAIELSDVTEDWNGAVQNGQCPSIKPFDGQSMLLLRAADGGPEFHLPWSNRTSDWNTYEGTGIFRPVSAHRWQADEEPVRNLPGHFPRALAPVSLNAFTVADAGQVLFENLVSVTSSQPYGFTSRGRLWLGDTTTQVTRVLDPWGAVGSDFSWGAFTTSEFPQDEAAAGEVWGAAATDDQVHFLAKIQLSPTRDALAWVSRHIPAAEVSETTPEESGRFFERIVFADGGTVGTIVSAPTVLPDGTRTVLSFGGSNVTSSSFARVLRSPAVDAPWAAGTPTLLSQGTSLVTWGGALFAMAYGEQLAGSADQGATWAQVSAPAAPRTGATQHLVSVSGGVVADVGDALALWRAPSATNAPLARWSVPPNFGGLSALPERQFRNVFDADGGVYFVAALTPLPQPAMLIARLDWNGALVSQFTTNTTLQYANYLVRQGVQVSPNEIVFPSYVGTGTQPVFLSRVNLETGAWQTGDAGAFVAPPSLVALRDGGLVLGGTMLSRSLHTDGGGLYRQERAVLLFSSDGLRWSAPRVIREEGGDGQRIEFLADDGRGGVLVVLDDSLSMGMARPRQVFQRVVLP